MQLACPKCHARDIRVSSAQGFAERLKNWIGISQLRCRRCEERWQTSFWANGAWKYARCPQCYRQELTRWNRNRYKAARWTRFLLRLGAKPYRCEACRCNFAAFRPRKSVYWRQHEIRMEAEALSGNTPPVEESGEQMP